MITIIFGLYLPGMTTFYKIDIPRILMKQTEKMLLNYQEFIY